MEAIVESPEAAQGKSFNYNLKWQKGKVISISPSASLREAAELMKSHSIGTLLVSNHESGEDLAGIITDRDIALCLAERKDFSRLLVADAMSETVISASEHDDILKLVSLMHQNGVSRIPLKSNSGQVIGIVTSKNILDILIRGLFQISEISEQQKNRMPSH